MEPVSGYTEHGCTFIVDQAQPFHGLRASTGADTQRHTGVGGKRQSNPLVDVLIFFSLDARGPDCRKFRESESVRVSTPDKAAALSISKYVTRHAGHRQGEVIIQHEPDVFTPAQRCQPGATQGVYRKRVALRSFDPKHSIRRNMDSQRISGITDADEAAILVPRTRKDQGGTRVPITQQQRGACLPERTNAGHRHTCRKIDANDGVFF